MENTSVTTVKDEVSGVLSRLCTVACDDNKALKLARDTLRRLALRSRDGEADYEEVVQRVLEKFDDDKTKDEWFVKYRLLEVFPIFAKVADAHLVTAAARSLLHENWMVRQAAVEALAFLMSQRGGAQPHIGSRPGSKTNSRPISPKVRREGGLSARPRPQQGLVVGEPGAITKGRKITDERDQSVGSSGVEGTEDSAAVAKHGSPLLDRKESSSGELHTAVQAVFHLASQALEHDEAPIRKGGLEALAKCLPVGHQLGVGRGLCLLADEAWECREAALHLLREIGELGDGAVTDAVRGALEDPRWEVREAAVRALETVAVVGDEELVEQLVSAAQHSKTWAGATGRPAWELRETACKALGVVVDADSEGGLAALERALGDESGSVARAAGRALGEAAERSAPADMVWSYHNATAQGGRPSTWLHCKWSAARQQLVPARARAPPEAPPRHSPRETRQALCRTPRGGPLPHLLTTPRHEHLYEGDAVGAALEAREARRAGQEREAELAGLAAELAAAVEGGDAQGARRVQQRMARLEQTEDARAELEDLVEGEEDEEREGEGEGEGAAWGWE